MKKKIRIKKTEFFVVDTTLGIVQTIRTKFDRIKEIMETEYEMEVIGDGIR